MDEYVLKAAKDTKPGDYIVFRMHSASYIVEEIDTDPLGNVRHIHSGGMGSSSYHPGEYLRVAK